MYLIRVVLDNGNWYRRRFKTEGGMQRHIDRAFAREDVLLVEFLEP